jgi:hypothetical protein
MAMNRSPKEKMKMEVMKTYNCPMHPDETSDKAGKCAKCGMDLKATEKSVKTFSCPMHPDISSVNAGKCTKCGMDLVASPKEKMKMEIMNIYTCPMHTDINSDKPGKCSKCNMDLKQKKGTPDNR